MSGIDDMMVSAVIDFWISISHTINDVITVRFIFRYIIVDDRFHIFCGSCII